MQKLRDFDGINWLHYLPSIEGIYYLASPYSHKNPLIKQYRYELVSALASILTNYGYHLFEPIGSSHPLAMKYELPTGYDFWKQRDRLMIERSDGIIVAQFNGWKESVGVQDEMSYAEQILKRVYYINPAEVFEYVDIS